MTRIQSFPWLRIGAESVAIIASILLAFAIDAWNERRVDRALEAEYLQRIGDELRGAKTALETILLAADGNLLSAPDLNEFFDGRMAAGDHERLIVAIYQFGRDPLLGFDVSTFDDLVSTGRLGLISDPDARQAIQRAYAGLQRLAPLRDPYRDEYLAALRAFIPSSLTAQIRAACPEYVPYSACSDLDLDDATMRSIAKQSDTIEGSSAFRMRELGLGQLTGIGRGEILVDLDETLARLGR